MFYRYSDYEFLIKIKAISNNKDVTKDGAKLVYISINIGSREKVIFLKLIHSESLGLGEIRFFDSQIFKYNTRLEKFSQKNQN